MAEFTPSTTPGCRLPFAKLADGRPVYDALGPGYTLLRFDPDVVVTPLTEAMRAKGVPFVVVDVTAGEAQPTATANSFWRAPTSTLPGAATRCRTIPRISSASCSAKT